MKATESPRVELVQLFQKPSVSPGAWDVAWSIGNPTPDPLTLESAWLPHGQFRSERIDLRSIPVIGPDETVHVQTTVRFDEPPGAVVENAFFILTARWRNEPWRILARLTVRMDSDGPAAETETMTIQQVGFSEASKPSVE